MMEEGKLAILQAWQENPDKTLHFMQVKLDHYKTLFIMRQGGGRASVRIMHNPPKGAGENAHSHSFEMTLQQAGDIAREAIQNPPRRETKKGLNHWLKTQVERSTRARAALQHLLPSGK